MNDELKNLRKALEIISKNSLLLKNFPRGCCGNSCYLIATYLEERSLGVFDYIEARKEKSLDSHAWLLSREKDCIIDLTADQFGLEPIIFLYNKHPLDEVFPIQKNKGNASIFKRTSVDPVYHEIYRLLDKTMKNLSS